MFDNIGGKIKGLATFFCVSGIIASIIGGISIIALDQETSRYSSGPSGGAITIGVMIIIFGSLISWISSFVLYGFGEIIDQLMILNGSKTPSSGPAQKAPATEPAQKTPAWLSDEQSERPAKNSAKIWGGHFVDCPKCKSTIDVENMKLSPYGTPICEYCGFNFKIEGN